MCFQKGDTDMLKLTQMAPNAGCAAKLGPGTLARILSELPESHDKNLLVGLETGDDACVYKISAELAVVSTVDFFPPIVDDPFTYGQIAAANALSDVYAMGGEPKFALNLLCASANLGEEAIREILRGGAEKAREAGACISGGHSIDDPVPKYGLCVTGFVNPAKMWTNAGAKPGGFAHTHKAARQRDHGHRLEIRRGHRSGVRAHGENHGAAQQIRERRGRGIGPQNQRLHGRHGLRASGPRGGDGRGKRRNT
jgi:hypothetical protein